MTETSWLTDGENAVEWAALVDEIELADFFQLHAIYLADASLEAPFVAAFAAAMGERWVRFESSCVADLLVDTPLDAAFRRRLAGASGWCLVARGAEPVAVARAAAILNQRRDVIRGLLAGPMVVVLHPLDWLIVRREAADLWSVHIGVCRFTAAPVPEPPRFPIVRPVCRTELRRVRGMSPRAVLAREERRSGHRFPIAVGRDSLEDVVRAALQAGLVGSELRQLLLAGLPPGFVYSLPTVSRPIDQLRFDLMELQRTPRLIGLDRPPLMIWLDNAIRLSGPRVEANEFRRLRDGLFGGGHSPSEPDASVASMAGAVDATGLGASEAFDLEALARLEASSDDSGTRACVAVDRAVLMAQGAHLPSAIRAALGRATSLVERLGDLRLIGRSHARAAWIAGHLGDRRSGLAEVHEGRRIVELLGIGGGDDLVTELDTVANWLSSSR